MKRPRRPKSKQRRDPAREDDTPLLDGSWRKVRARAVARADEEAALFSHARTHQEGIGFAEWLWGWVRYAYTRSVNFVTGLLLLPFCWMATDALFSAFARAHSRTVPVAFWQGHEFLMFAAGCAVWMAWFGVCVRAWGEPRPLRVYVLCHEFMHAAVARIFGGRIRDFHWSREGGHIVTDKYNSLIALAPYLWPLPAVPVLALWGATWWVFPEVMYHREWFLAALGVAWAFHVSFTCWMLPIGQTDFRGPGRLFSFALIYLVNLLLLTLGMIALAPELTLRGWGRELVDSAARVYLPLVGAAGTLLRAALVRLELA